MLSRSEDGVGEVIMQAEEPSVREWAAAVRQKGHGGVWQQLGPWLTPSRALNSKRDDVVLFVDNVRCSTSMTTLSTFLCTDTTVSLDSVTPPFCG